MEEVRTTEPADRNDAKRTDHIAADRMIEPRTYTLDIASPEVLARKSQNSCTERAAGVPEEGIDFTEGRIGRHGTCPKAVDGRLNEKIGDAVERRLNARRQADGKNPLQNRPVRRKITIPELDRLIRM